MEKGRRGEPVVKPRALIASVRVKSILDKFKLFFNSKRKVAVILEAGQKEAPLFFWWRKGVAKSE